MSTQAHFDKTGIHPDDCKCGGVMCEEDRRDKLAGNPPYECCAECEDADRRELELELDLRLPVHATYEHHYSVGEVRAAMFETLDAGDPDKRNHLIGWWFYNVESDTETERRCRFVDQVIGRLER